MPFIIIISNLQISQTNLESINRNVLDIMPPLSIMSLDKTHYEKVTFQWKRQNRIDQCNTNKCNITVFHCSTLSPDFTFDEVTNHNELEFIEEKIKTDTDETVQQVLPIEYDASEVESKGFVCSTTEHIEIPDSFLDNENFDSDQDIDKYPELSLSLNVEDTTVDGTDMDEEYATLVPISVKEAKAAMEVYKMFTQGKYHCEVCNKAYNNTERMKIHLRMHDKVKHIYLLLQKTK